MQNFGGVLKSYHLYDKILIIFGDCGGYMIKDGNYYFVSVEYMYE